MGLGSDLKASQANDQAVRTRERWYNSHLKNEVYFMNKIFRNYIDFELKWKDIRNSDNSKNLQ